MQREQIMGYRTTPTYNPLAIGCFALSILGLVVTWLVPFITQIAAIICGHIARSQIRNSAGSEKGSGIALFGLVVSYIVIALYIFVVMILGVGLVALLEILG
jgi:hypothetical protein